MKTGCWTRTKPTIFVLLGIYFTVSSISTSDSIKRICGYGKAPICCPGWHNNISSPCSIPSCAGNCGDHGQCIRPNTCMCADRRMRFSCDKADSEAMQQDQPTVSCLDDCNHHGTCSAGTCECEQGYTGESCEESIKSACFARLQRGLCINPVKHNNGITNMTSEISRELCCNSFGIAWGEPCQPCRPTYCGRGYMEQDGSCRDIDECRIPGVCKNGKCINTEGTYSCQCSEGYAFDPEYSECKPIKGVCDIFGHQCLPGGRCIPMKNREFRCLCDWGYVTSRDLKSCIPQKDIVFDICKLYSKSICKNGICVPRGNSYECSCHEGFELTIDRKSCRHKIDVCSLHRGYLCTNGECVPVGRDFYCQCNPGFSPSFDRRRCLNQCEQMGPNICPNGQCIALPYGDYECQCFPGYQHSKNRKHCVPDENTLIYEVPPLILYANDEAADPKPFTRISTRVNGDARVTEQRSHQRQWTPSVLQTLSPKRWNRRRMANSNPCSQPHIAHRCSGGICLNLGGEAYRCECPPGFESSNRGRYCTESKDQRNK